MSAGTRSSRRPARDAGGPRGQRVAGSIRPLPCQSERPGPRYNPDPTSVTAHTVKVTLPYNPPEGGFSPSCISVVGLAANGIPIDDGFDEDGNDAAAIETQDICHGHPNVPNGYHYHSLSPCLLSKKSLTQTTQVGWALDGYGIYVEYNAKGQLLTDATSTAVMAAPRRAVARQEGRHVPLRHDDGVPLHRGLLRGHGRPRRARHGHRLWRRVIARAALRPPSRSSGRGGGRARAAWPPGRRR